MQLLPTRTAVEEHNRANDVAVLPIGSYEQHGSHLPLTTDSIIAYLIASRLAETYNLFLLPPITFSCSHEHEGILSGSVSISSRTLYDLINDITNSLVRQGTQRLVLVNGHGGNYVLSNIVQEASVNNLYRMMLYPGREAWETARLQAGCVTSVHDDMHGGELETSIMLHGAPELVRENWRDSDYQAPDRPDLLLAGLSQYTPTGIIGTPSLATTAKGATLLNSLTISFSDRLTQLRKTLT